MPHTVKKPCHILKHLHGMNFPDLPVMRYHEPVVSAHNFMCRQAEWRNIREPELLGFDLGEHYYVYGFRWKNRAGETCVYIFHQT